MMELRIPHTTWDAYFGIPRPKGQVTRLERHSVVTDPGGRFGPRSRLYCFTCKATKYTEARGDELHQMAYTDLSWHKPA